MDKVFPRMTDRPEARQIVGGGVYWVFMLIGLPFLVVLMTAALGSTEGTAMGMYIAYCVVNLICTILIFRHYLEESFWNLRLDPKRFFVSVGLGLAVFGVLEVILIIAGMMAQDPLLFVCFPVAEPLMGVSSPYWVLSQPIVLGLAVMILAPITTCCLYYAVGFAVPAQDRPWLGYLIIVLMSVLPAVLLVTSGGREPATGVIYFVSMLPFHLCACWVYQRSDTIWAPIAFQTVINLLTIPVVVILLLVSALAFGTM